MNKPKRIIMPRLNTPNSLYKFIAVKLCHPMRIRVEDLTHWSVNDWYGTYRARHTYCIQRYENRMRIRYETDYWNEEIINKYD